MACIIDTILPPSSARSEVPSSKVWISAGRALPVSGALPIELSKQTPWSFEIAKWRQTSTLTTLKFYSAIAILYLGERLVSLFPLASNQKICFPIADVFNADGDLSTLRAGHNEVRLRGIGWFQHQNLSRPLGAGRKTLWTNVFWEHRATAALNATGAIGLEASPRAPFRTTGATSLGTLITNADQGVLYSWSVDFNNSNQPTYNLSNISGGAVTTVAINSSGRVTPLLQGQNGNFFGTVSGPQGTSMIAFGQSGNIQFIIAYFQCSCATPCRHSQITPHTRLSPSPTKRMQPLD